MVSEIHNSTGSYPTCALCDKLVCDSGLKQNAPSNCPMLNEGTLLEASLLEYEKEKINNLACCSALVEAEGYCEWTRIEEIIAFARKAGFRRIGLAYCIGLRREAEQFVQIMTQAGFEMVSAVCKVGSFPKENLGLSDDQKIKPGHFEAMCNPIAQARLLNKAQTQLKVVLGLCVGHDSLFLHYAESPVTVLAAKDRVLAHNPLGAIYAGSYFKKRFRG